MYFFISSWYKNNSFVEGTNQSWYEMNQSVSFDDTISHLTTFIKEDLPIQLMTLHYEPMLRKKLIQLNFGQIEYWNVFDHLQNIKAEESQPVSYLDLNWPEGTSFSFTNFVINAHLNGELLATIYLDYQGYLYKIERLEKKQINNVYYFDDRGFLSRLDYLMYGEKQYSEFFNEYGEWQFKILHNDQGKIMINPMNKSSGESLEYPSIEDWIREVLSDYLASFDDSGTILLADNNNHNQLVRESLGNHSLIYLIYNERGVNLTEEDFEYADAIVVDTEENREYLLKNNFLAKPLYHLTPFDTRLDLGNSQTIKELNIFANSTNLSIEEIQEYTNMFLEYMKDHPFVYLNWIDYGALNNNVEGTTHIIEHANTFLMDDTEVIDEYEMLEGESDNEPFMTRVNYTYLKTYSELVSHLNKTRLIVDLSEHPDPAIQIAGISKGIPHVNRRETDYVKHLKNGYILEQTSELPNVLTYYLSTLKHWNEALIHSINQIEYYSSDRMIEKWKNILTEVSNGKRA